MLSNTQIAYKLFILAISNLIKTSLFKLYENGNY